MEASQTCQFQKPSGENCRRKVHQGERFCWQHAKWSRKWKSLTRNQTVLFLLSVLAVPSLLLAVPSLYFSYVGSRVSRMPQAMPPSSVSNPTLMLNCEISPPVRWNDRLDVLETFPAGFQRGLVQEYGRGGKSNRTWPDSGALIYACKISNFDDLPVFDVGVRLGLVFQRAVKAEPQINPNARKSAETVSARDHVIDIPVISGHDNFAFYIHNPTPYFVEILLPEFASGELKDKSQRQAIRLRRPELSKSMPLFLGPDHDRPLRSYRSQHETLQRSSPTH